MQLQQVWLEAFQHIRIETPDGITGEVHLGKKIDKNKKEKMVLAVGR